MNSPSVGSIRGYELRERIGAGGFGEVYRAYQPSVGREVAIKVILPEHANHPDFIRRFETEAQLVARLEHLHIVPLYDYWREPDGAYLVMRWMRGGNLHDSLPVRFRSTAAPTCTARRQGDAHARDRAAEGDSVSHADQRAAECTERRHGVTAATLDHEFPRGASLAQGDALCRAGEVCSAARAS